MTYPLEHEEDVFGHKIHQKTYYNRRDFKLYDQFRRWLRAIEDQTNKADEFLYASRARSRTIISVHKVLACQSWINSSIRPILQISNQSIVNILKDIIQEQEIRSNRTTLRTIQLQKFFDQSGAYLSCHRSKQILQKVKETYKRHTKEWVQCLQLIDRSSLRRDYCLNRFRRIIPFREEVVDEIFFKPAQSCMMEIEGEYQPEDIPAKQIGLVVENVLREIASGPRILELRKLALKVIEAFELSLRYMHHLSQMWSDRDDEVKIGQFVLYEIWLEQSMKNSQRWTGRTIYFPLELEEI